MGLFIILIAAGSWFKRTRLIALSTLAVVCLILAARDSVRLHYASAMVCGLFAFLYLHRIQKDLAARAQGKPYDQEAEERGRRAAEQMTEWFKRHHLGWRGEP